MPAPYESWRGERREPYPAENATRWVNQLGPVLLEDANGRPRSFHDLVGEYLEKSELYLYEYDQHRGSTQLIGAIPPILSRRPWRAAGPEAVDPSLVSRFAWTMVALRKLQSGADIGSLSLSSSPRYSREDFLADSGMTPEEGTAFLDEISRTRRAAHPHRLREWERHSRLPQGSVRLASQSIPLSVVELEAEERRKPRGKGTVLLASFAGLGAVSVLASACVPVREASPATPSSIPTRIPTATRTPEPSPTPLPGGPDDERVSSPISAWPSLTEIPALRTDGGPFTFDADAQNVQAQLAAVKRLVTSSGWTIVPTPDKLTTGRTVYIAPFQDKDQWSIQALTADGVMVPIRTDGAIMDRPDWATRNVARYEEREHGLGTGYTTRYELVYDHWVPVVRSDEGERIGNFDLFSDDWVFDQAAVAEELVEVLNDDPNDSSTWPAEYRAYFENPQRYVGQRVEYQTDAFVTESRRGLLLNLATTDRALLDRVFSHLRKDRLMRTQGLDTTEIIKNMSSLELLWATLIHNAEIQESTILTPNDVRGIMVNRDAVVYKWTENTNGEYVQHGMWGDWATEGTPGLGAMVVNFSYEMDVFGKSVTIPRFPSHVFMGGRLAGIVELPGNAGTGMLLAYKDQGGGWHLQIFHVVYRNEAVQFDESMELCVGSVSAPSSLGFSKHLCPNEAISTRFQVGRYYLNPSQLRNELSTSWLTWPGPLVQVVMLPASQYHSVYQANTDSMAFHHPESGVEIARILHFFSVPYE